MKLNPNAMYMISVLDLRSSCNKKMVKNICTVYYYKTIYYFTTRAANSNQTEICIVITYNNDEKENIKHAHTHIFTYYLLLKHIETKAE